MVEQRDCFEYVLRCPIFIEPHFSSRQTLFFDFYFFNSFLADPKSKQYYTALIHQCATALQKNNHS